MQLAESISEDSKHNTQTLLKKPLKIKTISGVTCVDATVSLQLTWLSESFFTSITLKHSRLLGTQ